MSKGIDIPNLRCPKCGKHDISVAITGVVHMHSDGSHDVGALEFDGDGDGECAACRHEAPGRDFEQEDG